MEIALLLGLIILNGLFAMSEIALVAARRARLQVLAETGDTGAIAAIKLGENPTRFLSTVQIGITSIGVLNGIVGESALAGPFSTWLEGFGLGAEAADLLALILVVVSITYVSIVLGELVPKRIGQLNPEPIARLVARPMNWLAALTKPFVRLLTVSTEVVLRALSVRTDQTNTVTQEEIHALLAEGSESGAIEQHEHEMVRNVFRLDDRQIGSLMTPRSEIVFLDVEDERAVNLEKIAETDHSRYPVCKGGLDEVLGIATAKQILGQTLRGQQADFATHLQQVAYVPETLTGMELLENFRTTSVQMALVVDEYGEIQGLVTLQDLLEAITGEFKPHDIEDAWAVQREDGSWLLDGLIPVPELKDRLSLRDVPEEDKGRYHTLAGMLMLLLGRLPQTADKLDWGGWIFEVVDMDGKRIDKVLATRDPSADDSAPVEPGTD
ncbi:hemolysin family protein [Chitinimonas viridis]|uniref:Hemolysin family protein n=2 Tax=Chitinimonas TaxID=240411 RepID=A0ABT8B558_9NEIS|nr:MULTISPECIES: hemolysin family protein [Chitinimonas]MDN3577266.1 hemolysin family protein [Chitinimonas viridis]GLR13373.1 membrane protein [Chitinimonas prasina]